MEPTKGVYLPQIDVLRALAFSLVVIVHFTVPTWNAAISGDNIIYLVLDSVIKCGWFGVPIFLFVSGYSLALGKTGSTGTINWIRFYANRLLRVYPLYILCISVIAYTHQLPGSSVFNLALLQTQDVPKNSPFALLWSIQLEFACYLLFPVFLTAVRDFKSLSYIFLCLLFFRIGMYFLPTKGNWGLSYHSVYGGATLFLAGMCAAHYNFKHRLLLPLAILGLVLCSIFVTKHGGYGSEDVSLKWFWIFFPEGFSLICYCLVGGALSFKFQSKLAAFFAHIGKISYSGYVFHLFVLDFWLHLYGLPSELNSGISFAVSFLSYFCVLLVFSHISYNSFELLFLKLRRTYF
jgi:peptidoglycan/LPS O-acetylase OafA/YrhL